MAFCSKLSELTRGYLADVAKSECHDLIRANAIRAVENLCTECIPLAAVIKQASMQISKSVVPMSVYMSRMDFKRHTIELLKIGLPVLKRQEEHLMHRCMLTGQPLVMPNSTDNMTADLCHTCAEITTKPWVCLPMACGSQMSRGVLVIDTELNEGVVELNTVHSLEAAAVLLGTAVDLQIKADEISQLRTLHRKSQSLPVSIRDIYRRGLCALYRQLVCACRISIWQMQSISPIPCGNKSSAVPLSLFLEILHVHSSIFKGPITAIIYLDSIEVGRTHTTNLDASVGFLGFQVNLFILNLGKIWLSSLLHIELWRSARKNYAHTAHDGKLIGLLGLLELRGSYYLHLPACARAYALVDINLKPLRRALNLSLDMRLESIHDYSQSSMMGHLTNSNFPAESTTDLYLIQASITSTICSPGRYVCIFLDELGSELGQTPISCYTTCPKWINLNILLVLVKSRFSRLMRIELKLIISNKSPQIIAGADLSGASLIHFPRNKTNVMLQMLILRSKSVEPSKYAEEITLSLHLEQRFRNQARISITNCPGPRHISAVSNSRIVNGVLEFGKAPVKTNSQTLISAFSSCCTKTTCHIKWIGGGVVVVPFNDLAIKIGNQVVGQAGGTNFVVVIASGPGHINRENAWFIRGVTKIMEANLRHSRQRELRDRVRDHACFQISASCDSWASLTLPEIIDNVLHISSQCLPGCCVHLSLLQPGGDVLVCVASNKQSHVCGETMLRGQCTSFNCVGPKKKINILKDESFICVPLNHSGSVLGVIGADTFDYISKVHEAPKELPEDGVFKFLRSIGKKIGRAIDTRRKMDCLAQLRRRALNQPERICELALRAICCNVIFTVACEIWEMNIERQLDVILRVISSECMEQDSKTLNSISESNRRIYIASSPSLPSFPPTGELSSVLVTQMAMGELLDLTLHEKEKKLKPIGSKPSRLVVPLIGLKGSRMLVVVLKEHFQPLEILKSYVMAVAGCLQEALNRCAF